MFEESTTTPRGFRFISFTDVDGQPCSLQKSSLADEDAVWLGVELPSEEVERYAHQGLPLRNRMHLTQEMVQCVLPYLRHFAQSGCLDSHIPRGLLYLFFSDRYKQPGILYESRHEKRLTIRFGLDLTPHLDARQAQSDGARLQYYTQLSEAQRVLKGAGDERLDYTMHLSQAHVEALLPSLTVFAESGRLMTDAECVPELREAYHLIEESGASAAYTIEIAPSRNEGTYTIHIQEVPALSQPSIPADALVYVTQRMLHALLALGAAQSDGYQERLDALNAQGYIPLYSANVQ
ncbi:hypothetical protein KDA_74860 [Dictyobacter alpinus]|uniref:Uncharacterized protein n=1 Tax=Dictyobacter alpinus TaxID=2014873 RepID=A0A402BKZ2_9CHLR|nr:hypothetical protein [Dictyobacter alpinus]GCE32002.1 hypothetical protein KDA_74860 [Dictyobacter alpinus]